MTTMDQALDEAAKLGRRIRALREKRGWSQERLGRETGLSRETVRRAETGRAMPEGTTIYLIAHAFGMTMSRFLDFGSTGRYHQRRAA